MIELPEARTLSKELREEIMGKKIVDIGGQFEGHKFTFYYKDPNKYKDFLIGKKVTNIIDRSFYIEIEMEDYKLVARDGANIRYYDNRQDFPENSKLLIEFEDGSFLNFTVSMYAFISICKKDEDMGNIYYDLDINGISPLNKRFTFDYFLSLRTEATKKLSAKAFLATEQRIPGIGNGVVQDILFYSTINPKTKIRDLSDSDFENLYHSVITTINKMIDLNGRDTEKDIYGNFGHYKTVLSRKNYKDGCPRCSSEIRKENFLGGSIYYCPSCQK